MPVDHARTLVVMRHAEAAGGGPGVPDASRPLTAAGRHQAAARAPAVAATAPQLVLCSAALRTRQTLAALGDLAGAVVEVSDAIYEASATSLLLRLAEVDDVVRTVLVVGHMPTVAALVAGLTGARDAPPFPPAALSVLALQTTWGDLRAGSGTLIRHLG